MSLRLQEFLKRGARTCGQKQESALGQAERVSSDVAEVANRPKKRPGSRERSSMMTRQRPAAVVLV